MTLLCTSARTVLPLTRSCLPFRYKLMTHETTGKDRDDLPNTLPEIAWLFLKLGSIGFGGRMANTALMEQEVVTMPLADPRALSICWLPLI